MGPGVAAEQSGEWIGDRFEERFGDPLRQRDAERIAQQSRVRRIGPLGLSGDADFDHPPRGGEARQRHRCGSDLLRTHVRGHVGNHLEGRLGVGGRADLGGHCGSRSGSQVAARSDLGRGERPEKPHQVSNLVLGAGTSVGSEPLQGPLHLDQRTRIEQIAQRWRLGGAEEFGEQGRVDG